MNNDIVFGIAKYLEKKTGYKKLDEAFSSHELFKEKIKNSSKSLEKKLLERPSIEELKEKNILRCAVPDFDYIHSVLETIEFKENESKISPRIASVVKKLDFKLKRSFIIRKLKLKEDQK
jgi:hypothetical protein